MGYDLGDTVTVAVTVRDAAGAPTTPTTAVLSVLLPDGTTVTPAVGAPSSPGEYSVDYVPATAGHYEWRFAATGPTAALNGTFDVTPAFPGLIVGLPEAKRKLRIPAATTQHDEDLRRYCAAATRAVERYLRQVVVRRTVTELVDVPYGARRVFLESAPIISVTSITRVDAAGSWSPSVVRVDPDGWFDIIGGGPSICGLVEVVLVAGYQQIPDEILQAAEYIVQHLFEVQQQSGLGRSTNPFGSDTDATPSGLGYAIPNRAVELLGPPPEWAR